jgi:2-polyprenyl-3-methyl-5-hydroxy-6-metoxy-1,4-benzoquinol methylase
MKKYFEPHYKILDESLAAKGLVTLGPMASFTWNSDPKRLLFVLSRYKFAARVLEGAENVIEIGCGDGFASRIVKQHVKRLVLTDADPRMVRTAGETTCVEYPVESVCHNFAESLLPASCKLFDGAYLLDVLEHIEQDKEITFLKNIKTALAPGAKVIIGTPSKESQEYASDGSKAGHVNCKTKEELHTDLKKIFNSVTCFSMNDEVVHTGFSKMSNYLIAVCIS